MDLQTIYDKYKNVMTPQVKRDILKLIKNSGNHSS